MNIKTGIDIIEVNRIEENIMKFGDAFTNKIFTKKEIEYCESKGVNKYQSYAGRFAGKEAVFKAISDALDNKFQIGWKDIEICNDESFRPYVNVNVINKKIEDIDISISHIKDVAVASVVVIFN